MDKINPTDEQGGLMGPVNVIPAGSSNMNGSGSGGVKATSQNLKYAFFDCSYHLLFMLSYSF